MESSLVTVLIDRSGDLVSKESFFGNVECPSCPPENIRNMSKYIICGRTLKKPPFPGRRNRSLLL